MSQRSDDPPFEDSLLPTLAGRATLRFVPSEVQQRKLRPTPTPQQDGAAATPAPGVPSASQPGASQRDSFRDDPDDPDVTVILDPSQGSHPGAGHGSSYPQLAAGAAAPSAPGVGQRAPAAGGEVDAAAETHALDAQAILGQRPSSPAAAPAADPVAVSDAARTSEHNVKEVAPAAGPPQRGARSGDMIGGRYLVEGQIGRGGMGRVLRVRHEVLGKPFALKLIKAPIATDPKIREMFDREAKLASSLSHENICTIVDYGTDDRFGLFMVMELLKGETLFHRLYKKGRFAPKVACDIIWQIAEALRYIHDQSIIHGDIKSENILLTRTQERRRLPKLLDFGLARATVNKDVGGIEGTPEYLAPERIYGGAPSTYSDIYALGMMFYELLIGGLPFRGSIEQVFRMQVDRPVPKVSEQLEGTIDERVDDIISRATAKDPEQRHADVSSFMYELRTLMNMLGMPLPGRVRRGSSSSSRNSRQRSRSVAQQRSKAPAEVFEYAPIPLATLNREGRVRLANHAFWKFLGVEDSDSSLHLMESPFAEVYPNLLHDLETVATLRQPVKRVLQLGGDDGELIEVAVILSAAPGHATATAGEIYLTLHPLGRSDSR
ncbi:MAG: hypothetical protein Tsb0020_18590 [Haliangiales bacterium]